MSDRIRIACISDTHDIHYPEIPEVDAVIHAGDISLSGSRDETLRFLDWFDGLKIDHKIFIGGNHDAYLEREHGALLGYPSRWPSVTMLLNSSYDLEGYKVWGSPVSPAYGHIRAFAREREELDGYWDRIPDNADIVVTHGPAHGMVDRAVPIRGHEHLGDSALYKTLSQKAPQYHICGHIHGSRGTDWIEGTTFINASVLNEAYRPWHIPITVIELPRKVAGEKECQLLATRQDVRNAL